MKNKVIVGAYGPSGSIDAFDAQTGKVAWQWNTLPKVGETGSETWGGGDPWKAGGGPVWLTGSYDPQLNLLYWGTGQPNPDFIGERREGDNLYTDCVVALDPDTGKLKWFFQFTPHDVHDWDAVEIPVLVDTVYQGQPRKLLVQANRNGYYYVLDRTNGKFLHGVPFVKSLNWASGLSVEGRPILVPGKDPSVQGTKVCPPTHGATNWPSPAYNPDTHLFYFLATEGCGINYRGSGNAAAIVSGSGTSYAESLEESERWQNYVRALDVTTGKLAWDYKQVGSNHYGPGVLSTGGGLVFAGRQSGNVDGARREDRQAALALQHGRENHGVADGVRGRGQRVHWIAQRSKRGRVWTSGSQMMKALIFAGVVVAVTASAQGPRNRRRRSIRRRRPTDGISTMAAAPRATGQTERPASARRDSERRAGGTCAIRIRSYLTRSRRAFPARRCRRQDFRKPMRGSWWRTCAACAGRRSMRPPSGTWRMASRSIWGKGGCSQCHMLQGKGGLLGPDLSTVANRRKLYSIKDALTKDDHRVGSDGGRHEISLEPSFSYQGVRVTTRAGKTFSGVLKNEDSFSLQMMGSDNELHLFTRDELREVVYEKKSLMPSDYDKKLTPEELQDLLAFLSRSGDTGSALAHSVRVIFVNVRGRSGSSPFWLARQAAKICAGMI